MALELLSLLCTFENSTKCSKIRLRFFSRIAKRSIKVAHSENLISTTQIKVAVYAAHQISKFEKIENNK